MEHIASSPADQSYLASGAVISFPNGLPGFHEHQRFSLAAPDDLHPLVYLQSLAPPYPRFILLPARLIDAEYQVHLEPWDRDLLFPPGFHEGIRLDEEITLYFVVSVAENSSPTVNMLAPIAIRTALLLGVQAVRSDRRYSHAQPLPAAESRVS